MTEGVPLVIPEVNPEAMKGMRYGQGGIIANPNCSTIIALMAVTPLHRAAKVMHIQEQVKFNCAALRWRLHAVLASHAEQGSSDEAMGAVLCCAVLCCAVLCCAVLCCAVLCCAVLCCAVLCCAVHVKVNLCGWRQGKRYGRQLHQAADAAGQAV